jgi:hypothetical protein
MDHHSQLAKWATDGGVKVNGVAAHDFPGRGLGIIATKNLRVSCHALLQILDVAVDDTGKAGETILSIPVSFIRTEFSLPKQITSKVKECTMNGLLAVELTLDKSKSHAVWRKTLPSLETLKSCMPFFWVDGLQAHLPEPATALLKKQQRRLASDWKAVSTAYPDLTYDGYVHAWLLISTRTFYYTPPDMLPEDTPEADECLAIVPFGDYFNHSAHGCKVNYSAGGYEFVLEKTVRKGEELYISYGNHTNDFLLVEYGFTLHDNEFDLVNLDEAVLQLLSTEQKKILEDADFLGNYSLSVLMLDENETLCYRTITALRLLIMPMRSWKKGLRSGFDEDDKYAGKLRELERKVLSEYLGVVSDRRRKIDALQMGTQSHRQALLSRWKQIAEQLEAVLNRMELD